MHHLIEKGTLMQQYLAYEDLVKSTFMQRSYNICAMLLFTFSKSIVCTFEYQQIWNIVNTIQK